MRLGESFEKQPERFAFAAALLISLVVVVHGAVNVRPAVCQGLGDCVKYTQMARAFAQGTLGAAIDAPFNLRILAPWLASKISPEVTSGFLWLNGISALVLVISWCGMARSLGFRNAELAVFIAWFFLHPLGFRFYFAIPESVDPLFYGFIGTASFFFLAEQRAAFWITILCALFVKESFVFVALIATAAELIYAALRRDRRARGALLSAAAVVPVLVAYSIAKKVMRSHLFPQNQPWEITALSMIEYFADEVRKDPNRLLVWVGAFICSTGFFSILAIGRWKLVLAPLRVRQFSYLALGTMGFVLFGLVAGSDMSRIIFNGNVLIIPAFLFVSRYSGASANTVLIVFSASAVLAWNYMIYFPAAFEYEYYGSHHYTRTAYFVILTSLVALILRLLIYIQEKARKRRSGDSNRQVASARG